MKEITGLILAKENSTRLINKNWRHYKGKPMYQWNLEKCLHLFNRVYVSSDSEKILNDSEERGAIRIKRPEELLEATNIACYKHAQLFMQADAFIAVQANSPETGIKLIKYAKDVLQLGNEEVKTCHYNGTDYGSIWGMTAERLKNYPDPLKARPEVWIKDFSIDIHNIEDLYESYEQYKKYKQGFSNLRTRS